MTDRGTIAIIDDDPVMLELLQRRLSSRLDMSVMLFPGGESYLQFFSTSKPSIVLLDAHLEGMSGLELLAKIRESCSRIELPVIFISGDAESNAIVSALESGANDYVVKPLDMDVLAARMRVHLSLPGTFRKETRTPGPLADGQTYPIVFLYCQVVIDPVFAASRQGGDIHQMLSQTFETYARIAERYRGSLWLRKDDAGFFAFPGTDNTGPVMCAIELLTLSAVHGLLQERSRHFMLSLGLAAGPTVYRTDPTVLQSDPLNRAAHLAKEASAGIRAAAEIETSLPPAALQYFEKRPDGVLSYRRPIIV